MQNIKIEKEILERIKLQLDLSGEFNVEICLENWINLTGTATVEDDSDPSTGYRANKYSDVEITIFIMDEYGEVVDFTDEFEADIFNQISAFL
jgi:hypothetical protein